MASMPDINKKFLSAQLPLEMIAQLKREAKIRKMTVTDLLAYIIDKEVGKVELTSSDYTWIANEVKKNEDKRREKK